MNAKPYRLAKWQRFRASVLAGEPLCRACRDMGRGPVTAKELHHILPVSQGGALYDLDNVMPLCSDCHRRIGKDGVVGTGTDGKPIAGSSHWWAHGGKVEQEREWSF